MPEDVLENPDFATWRTKTILCEGSAGDISSLDRQHIEQTLTQRFLPGRIKKLWSEYFEAEAERKEADMKLTALQKKTLKIFSRVNKRGDFYFTGGTALAVCYLHHRESDDLDFFTADPASLDPAARDFENTLRSAGLNVQVERRQATFVRLLIEQELKVDLALDTPFRLKPTAQLSINGIKMFVDDLEDIAANKMLALFGRAEPRDFIDVYFLSKEYFDFIEMTQMAAKKDTGFDLYWLAAAMQEAEKMELLPVKILKPFNLQDMKKFYQEQRVKLLRRIVGKSGSN
ncbi:MAG: nucleotidyl transferase AbiEii/AbiGii toxin family protein [Candidatus Bathyarchaeia archaeon]